MSRSALLVAVVLAATLAVGCAPSLLWHGRSPDRASRAAIVARDGREVLEVDGIERGGWDEIAMPVRWSARGPVAMVRRGERWSVLDGDREGEPFDAIRELTVEGATVAYAAADREGWRVIVQDDRVSRGRAFDALRADTLRVVEGRAVYVGRDGRGDHVVVGEAIGEAYAAVHGLAVGAKGRTVGYAGVRGDGEDIVIDGAVVARVDEVLELALAADAPRWAAIVAQGEDTVLVHGTDDGAIERVRAPILTHLRISDDGEHALCLRSEVDGSAIEVWLDGAALVRARRVDGERLAFVPGTARVVVVREDAQGPVVWIDGAEGERYEEVEGPVLAPRRAGWVGRRRGRSVVVIDGAPVGDEAWAGSLRLAREGDGYAYVARGEGPPDDAQRAVVTQRGRWPVPRLYVDTLVVDASGHHWAALVPDPAARRLSIWVDGAPRSELDVDEVSAAMLAQGTLGPRGPIHAIVEAELAHALAQGAP